MLLHRYIHDSHGEGHPGASRAVFRRGGFGRHGFGRHGFPGGRGGRRRGDTKYEMLAILAEGPRHGYDLMLEMERRTGRKPSPGSIYPNLQALEEGGFLAGSERDGKRVYEITDAGRTLLAERPDGDDENAGPGREGSAKHFVRAMMASRAVVGAAREVLRTGDPELVDKVAKILEAARKEIYTLLADAE